MCMWKISEFSPGRRRQPLSTLFLPSEMTRGTSVIGSYVLTSGHTCYRATPVIRTAATNVYLPLEGLGEGEGAISLLQNIRIESNSIEPVTTNTVYNANKHFLIYSVWCGLDRTQDSSMTVSTISFSLLI